jgi:hypothetical protein
MATNRIMRGGATLRGLALLAVAALLAVSAVGCGGGGGTTTSVPDKEADGEVLNEILARQMAAVAAYEGSLPALRGRDLAIAREFRAQEQEHVDAIVKALRGLGGEAEPEPEELEAEGLKKRQDHLRFLYEVESATIDSELSAISKLTAPWPRALLASIVADQAQHLVLLRRALGARPLATVPDAFEDGTTPAP